MNTLYLVRHGENRANITKEFSHKKVDYPLTEKGVLQARQTAEYFKDRHVDEVYSSPLRRAVQTAEIIAQTKGLPVTIVEALREVNSGHLEDTPPSEETWRVYLDTVRGWNEGRPEVALPGGENYFTLANRIRQAIGEIIGDRDGRQIVVAGHGGIFTAAIGLLCKNVEADELRSAHYHNCGISQLEVERTQDGKLEGTLIGWAYCEHLSGRAAELISPIPDMLVPAERP
ncbi:MAG TPA: histidine phosphatase family protein [Chloroflexia bacterium]|jgi:broad specificity phosphatase PhoE